MNDDVQRQLARQLREHDRRFTIFRQGVVTALTPLTVKLGDAGSSYTGVSTLAGPHAVSDVVSCLLFGNDLVVIGTVKTTNIGRMLMKVAVNAQRVDYGVHNFTWPGGTAGRSISISHALGVAPYIVLSTQFWTGYICAVRPDPASLAAAAFTMKVDVINGASPPNGTGDGFYWLAIG